MNIKLLTTKQAAEILLVSTAFLERDRFLGATIPYVKVGARAVRYRLDDIQAHLEKNLVIGKEISIC